MNVLFAWFLFTLTFMIGIPTQVDEAQATDEAQLMVADTTEESPAQSLPIGATINQVTVGEETLNQPLTSQFIDLVSQSGDRAITVEYTEGDNTQTVELQPVQGLIEDDPERYGIGVALMMVDEVSKPFWTSVVDGLKTTIDGLQAITVGLFTLISQSFTGQADFSQVAGPVGIVGMVGDAASFGIATLLTFTAIISLNLAVINLLPFPALDGGRLVFVAIESVTRKPIPPIWAGRVNLVGFAILMLLMIAVTYNDILRLM
jgi:regulator of sigma E protease